MTHTTMDMLDELLARENLPVDYRSLVENWVQPLALWLSERRERAGRPIFVGLHGAQGSGKTTLCKVLALLLAERGIKTLSLSLDDFYLSKQERLALASDVHPLFATRGVPGTHDIAQLRDAVTRLLAGDSVTIPAFDKAADDRFAAAGWSTAGPDVDLVLLEGWCVGCIAADEAELQRPVNVLEAEEDPDGRWRLEVNDRLRGDYGDLFADMDALIMLQVPSMEQVLEWRTLQERKLGFSHPGQTVMTESGVRRFVQFYERLTRRALREMPARADYVLELDARHNVSAARIKR